MKKEPPSSSLRFGEAYARTESEDSIVFASGALAMMGTVAALAGPRDLVILDRYAHASLVCGAKMSGAQMKFFQHNDLEQLEAILVEARSAQSKMVVVDGVYSMQGDMAPLPEICDLCEKYGVRLLVDDAHGTGVCGKKGRGTAELMGVEDRIDLHLGTFSKALGTTGGFVTGDRTVIEFLRCTAPTIIFTKALPAAVAAATIASIKIMSRAHDRRKKVWKNTKKFQTALKKAGYDLGTTQTPITPISGNGTSAVHMGQVLYEEYNIWVSPAIYPAVPIGTSILRAIPTANHAEADLDYFLKAVTDLKERKPDLARHVPEPAK